MEPEFTPFRYFAKKIVFVLILITAGLLSHGQNSQVLTTSGGYIEIHEIQYAWSLGECLIHTISDGETNLTQGFHQSFSVVTTIEEKGTEGICMVYPNPTSSSLYVKQTGGRKSPQHLKLVDPYGRVLVSKIIIDPSPEYEIDLSPYAEGLYILHLINQDTQYHHSIRIIKQ